MIQTFNGTPAAARRSLSDMLDTEIVVTVEAPGEATQVLTARVRNVVGDLDKATPPWVSPESVGPLLALLRGHGPQVVYGQSDRFTYALQGAE